MTNPTIRLDDILKVYMAFHALKSVVNEVSLTADQHARKLDSILGEVILNRIISSVNAAIEVQK